MTDPSIVSSGERLASKASGTQHGNWWSSGGVIRGTIRVNSDYRDLLAVFNRHEVKYLVVGGYAYMRYALQPRFTKDLDVWVEPTSENAVRTYEALAESGLPSPGLQRLI